LMQALSNGYYLIFFPVLAALWMLWFTLSRTRVRMMAAIIGAWAVASLPLVPLLWTYRRILTEYGFQRGIGEINTFSADLVSLLDPPVLLKFWNQSSFHKAEGELFPGMTAVLLVLLVVVHWLWKLDRSGRVPRTCLALLFGASVFIAVSLSAVLVGPWSITIGGATLVSVRVVSKPLTIGVLLLVVALGLEPRFVAAWRRRSPLMFYTLAMTMMYVLCFGPEPRFFGVPVMYRAPYSWLMALPGYNAVRVPARFAMLGALCLSVAAALAFGRLTSRSRWSARATLAAFAVAGVLVDSWIAKIPLPVLPPPPQLLASLPAEATVIELPLGDSSDDVGAIYRGMYHRRPVFNGYSGFFPSSYGILREGFGRGDPRMFDIITAATPVVVVLDERRDPGGRWAEQLRNRPGSTLLGQESIWKIFSLPGGAHPREFERSRRLPIPVVSANVHEDRIALVLDGDPNTRWESGPQSGIEVVTIDLGVRRTVEGLSMTIGEHPADFPRMLVIETSDDGREWSTQWTGSAEITAIAGAMHHPGEIPLTFALPEVPARWLRLRQLGEHEIFYWSICELAVFGQ
jgi:F5/8 type C domain